jgi:hypothetical protein
MLSMNHYSYLVSSKLIISILFLTPQLYAGKPVCQTINGITITAQAMSAEESKHTFGQNLHTSRIYPIRLYLINERGLPVSISIESIQVLLADVLTDKSLKSSIDISSGVAAAMTIVCFPIGLATQWHRINLKKLLSIVEKFSMGDRKIMIHPSQRYETFIFPQFPRPPAEPLKDEKGNRLRDSQGKVLRAKRPDFVAPESLETTVKFLVDTSNKVSSIPDFAIPVNTVSFSIPVN